MDRFPLIRAGFLAVALIASAHFAQQAHAIGTVGTTSTTQTLWRCSPTGSYSHFSPQSACTAQGVPASQSAAQYCPTTGGGTTTTTSYALGDPIGTTDFYIVSTTNDPCAGTNGGQATRVNPQASTVSAQSQTGPGTPSCGPGTTASAGTCVCDLGSKPAPGTGPTTCVPTVCPPKPDTGSILGPFTTQPGKVGQDINWCDARPSEASYGCNYKAHVTMEKEYPVTSSATGWYQVVNGSYSGLSCQGGPDTAPVAATPSSGVTKDTTPVMPAPATSCAGGTCPGTVNGASVCLACTRVVSEDATGVTASGSQTASGAANGTAGSLSRIVADCNASTCQITTTVKDLSGNVIAIATGQQGKEQFCRDNPKSGQCSASSGTGGGGGGSGEESAFGGVCAATTCSGDAVVCAIAQEQHKRDCQMATNFGDGTTTTGAQAGLDAVAVGDAGATDHPHRAANIAGTSLSLGFDQTNILSGSCPADRTIGPVVLPLSKLCTPAGWLGNLLVGLTAFACLGIVFLRS